VREIDGDATGVCDGVGVLVCDGNNGGNKVFGDTVDE